MLNLCCEVGFELRIFYKGFRIDLIINMIVNDMGIVIVMEKIVRNLLKENIVIFFIFLIKESYFVFMCKIGEYFLVLDIFWEYLR